MPGAGLEDDGLVDWDGAEGTPRCHDLLEDEK